jgi:hypothetical protein
MSRIAKQVKWGYLLAVIPVISLTLLFSQHFVVKAAGSPQPAATPLPFIYPPNLSGNRAGYQALSPLHTFNKIQASFIVPTLDLKQSKPGDQLHLTVALGGNPNLINPPFLVTDIGVKSTVDPSGHQQNELWWKPAGPLPEQLLPFTRGIHVGDIINVTLQSNVNNDNNVVFTFLDKTTGETKTGHVSGQQYLSDGSAGACWVERVFLIDKATGTPTGTPFAAFEPVKFLSCALASTKNPTALTPIGSFSTLQKTDITHSVSPKPAPPTAQTKPYLVLTATGNLDATKQSFVIAPSHKAITLHRGKNAAIS